MISADDPGGSGDKDPGPDFFTDWTVAELLELLWANLADVMGTAATATLLRRAIRRAASSAPMVDGITIVRTQFDYQYSLSESWHQKGDELALQGLRSLIKELLLLLVEMTGPVVVRRLERIPALRHLGMTLGEQR
jgi:hypothetical protein